jgi:hypothetical protein
MPPLPKFLLNGVTIAFLFAGLCLRIYWRYGGADIAYWLGGIAIGMFGLLFGVLIFLRTINKRRIPPILFGIVISLLGILLLLNTIQLMIARCHPEGC